MATFRAPPSGSGFRTPVLLEGRTVRLVPLDRQHVAGLWEASRDPEVDRFLAAGIGRTPAAFQGQVEEFLRRRAEGTELPFCQVLVATGAPVGVTRFLHIDRDNQSVEIGGTWIDRRWWRTPVNTEAKYLLFRHAFETERFHRVWLQTDLRNERSQRAIARLGAVRDGVLREDRLVRNGYFRSSVVFSVVAGDWPRVRAHLEELLARPWTPPSPSLPDGPG